MTSADEIKKLGTILSVWAHPDDETFTAAGIMALAIKNGQKVVCVTATKGEAGSQDIKKWPPERLGEVRAAELKEALAVLGITNHHWLGYRDGECEKIDENDATSKILGYIETYQPDTILTFGPEGMTGHPDHASVSRWVSAAASKASKSVAVYHAVHTPEQYEDYLKELDEKLNVFFNIDKPKLIKPEYCALCCELPDDICRLKCEALAKMPSQTEVMLKLFDRDFMARALSSEAFVKV